MNINQKDLVLIPFLFSDQSSTKVRPALVVSSKRFNKEAEDYIAVPLTSVIKNVKHSFLIFQNDLSLGNLIKPSRIRTDKIFTIKKKLLITKIGSLKEETFKKIKEDILNIF